MKRILLLAVLTVPLCVFAEDVQTRLIELRNTSDFGRLGPFVAAFGVNLNASPNPHFVVLRGTKEQLDAAEAAIRKIDVPVKDLELFFQIVAAGTDAAADKIPADLEPVIKQIRKTFVFQSFRLVDTIQIRTRERTPANGSSAVPGSITSTYQVFLNQAEVGVDDKGSIVRLDNLRFAARVPTTVMVKGAQETTYLATGFEQSIDVRAGQKVVVGRANLNSKDGAYFLVVTANVLD